MFVESGRAMCARSVAVRYGWVFQDGGIINRGVFGQMGGGDETEESGREEAGSRCWTLLVR